jgi:two-component system LytT family sensor kinase
LLRQSQKMHTLTVSITHQQCTNMNQKRFAFKEGGWLKTNLKYGSLGVVIGLVISLLTAIFNPEAFTVKRTLFSVLFSFFITLSISNVIALTQRFFTPTGSGFWKFIMGYYVCSLIGLFIGIELTYVVISLLFQTPYQLTNHVEDYKFTTIICLVISTIILLFQFQKQNAAALLRAKEMDLVKLNQLKTQIELQALQAKINPHFLYNALNAIVSLIHEDPDKAEDMTIKLSKLFRYSINTMQENFCSIKEEVEILETYLAIEKVRFGNRIEFEIDYPTELEQKRIPRFLLQPLVENALKHGLKDVDANGLLKVKITQNENSIVLIIHDNGIPFPDELVAGYGLQSTFDKLQLLYKDGHDFQLHNSPTKHLKITLPLN